MKLPARLALVASTGILLVAGLSVATGFASTVRDSGADSVQSINRTTSMLSLEQSRQTNLLGSLGSQGNDIQSNGNLGEAQFVRGRFGGQVVDRPENIQSWLRATLDDSGDITQEKMDHRLDKAEERINAVLNGEGHKRMHKGKDRSRGRTRGEDQSFRPNRGGDTQIDSETTAL